MSNATSMDAATKQGTSAAAAQRALEPRSTKGAAARTPSPDAMPATRATAATAMSGCSPIILGAPGAGALG